MFNRTKGSTSSSTPPHAKSAMALQLRALEPRVLLDAAAASTVAAATEQHAQPTPEPSAEPSELMQALAATKAVSASSPAAEKTPVVVHGNDKPPAITDVMAEAKASAVELYFIDSAVADPQALISSLGPNAEVHMLQADRDGLEQVAEVLQGRSGLDAIHILSHGSSGELQLGNTSLTSNSMQAEHRDELASIGRSLTDDGDILIYGCDFAEGEGGAQAVKLLSSLTSADIAASNDDTGAERFGGNWSLEYNTGAIETASVNAVGWNHLMAPPMIDLNGAAAGSNYSTSFVENGAAAAIADAAAQIVDVDSTDMQSAIIILSNRQPGDVLSLGTMDAAISGTIDTSAAGRITVTLNGAASSAAYAAAIRNITFANTSDAPSTVARTINVTVNDGTVDSAITTTSIAVTAVNDAPVLADTDLKLSSVIASNGAPTNGQAVGKLVSELTGGISDVDTGALKGIAITSLNQGTVYYSLNNGTTWVQVTSVSGTSALLLAADANTRIYFRPNAGVTGDIAGAITLRAWDQTSGTNGGTANVTATGGVTAFSNAADTVTVRANTAPVLSNSPVLEMSLAEDAPVPSGAVGSLLSGFTVGISDVDAGASKGIAVTATVQTNGTWWYTADGGTNWQQIGAVSTTNALLLADNPQTRLYFQPNANFNGNASSTALTFRAWDQSSGEAGTKVNPGTSNAFSATNPTETIAVTVTPVNDAPVLTDTARSLTTIAEDANTPSGAVGTPVTSFISTTTDVDTGALSGIAITAADTSNGTWFFSINNGATWTALGAVSDSAALLLSNVTTSRLYFQPTADFNGSITSALTIRAWDQTSGTNGAKADTSSNGGITAFSAATDTVAITVNPVADIVADAVSTLEDTAVTFNPITGAGGNSGADNFENPNRSITAIAGQAIVPGGDVVAVPNGTVSLAADGATLTFTPAADFSGSSTFSYSVVSGAGAPETANITLTISAVGDGPRIDLDGNTTGNNYSTIYDQGAVAIGELISITDPEGNNLASITITIANATAADNLALIGNLPAGLIGSYNAATGVYTITGNSTLTNYQTALNAIRFTTSSAALGSRTVSVSAVSGTAPTASNIAIATFTVLDSDGDGVANASDIDDDNDGILDEREGGSLSGVELINDPEFDNSTAWVKNSSWEVFDSGIELEAAILSPNTTPSYIEQTITTVIGGSYDFSLWMHARTGSPYQEFAGLFVNGVQIGVLGSSTSYSSGLPPDSITATFVATSTTTIIRIQALPSTAGHPYSQPGDGWGEILQAVSVKATSARDSDGDGAVDRLDLDSDNDGITDNVEAQASQSYIAPSGQSAAMIDIDRDGLDDVYDANTANTTAASSVGLIPVDTDSDGTADIRDGDSDGDGVTDIVERGDGQPTSITSITDTDRDGLLDIFEAGNVNDGFDVNDENLIGTNFNLADSNNNAGADGSNAAPRTIDFDYREDTTPLENVLPAGWTVNEDGTFVLNGLAVTDNSPNGVYVVTLTVASGTLTASATGNVTVAGSGTSSLTLSGSLADINAFLASASAPVYTTVANANGIINLQMVSKDGGGGPGALTDTDNAPITIVPINDAPVLADTVLTYTAYEDDPAPVGTVGALISTLTAGISDVDPGAIKGIAVTAASPSNGVWWFTVNGGANWSLMGAVSNTNALLLADNPQTRLYFQATTANFNGNGGTSALTIRAWDQTSGVNGSKVTTTPNGTTSAFSTATDLVAVTITAVNDAPVLNPASDRFVNTVNEDNTAITNTWVPTFYAAISDVDAGALQGVAIIGVDTSIGTWYYTTDNTATWTAIGGVSETNALLLNNSTNVRIGFVPAPDYNGTVTAAMTIRAWDQTSGVNGGRGNASINGGSTAFSVESDTVRITVNAIADIVNDNVSTLEDTPVIFNPITGFGEVNGADNFESPNRLITAIGGLAITPGGAAVNVPNGTVSLAANGATLTFTPNADFNGNSTFTYTVSSGGTTETASISITVTSVADAPRIDLDTTMPGSDYVANYDQGAVAIGNLVSVSDPEGNNLVSMTITIADATAADGLSVSGTLPLGLTGSYNASTGAYTITGNSSLANYQTALGQIRFVTSSGTLADRTLSVVAVSGTAPTQSNLAIVTFQMRDADGDGIANAGDIDDDNDGVIDFNESIQSNTNFNYATYTGTAGSQLSVSGISNGTSFTFSSTQPINTAGGLANAGSFPAQYAVPNVNPTLTITNAGTYTLTFASPVRNPVFVLSSIGAGGIPVEIDFSVPYELIFSQAVTTQSTTHLTGREGNAIIRLLGEGTSFTFTTLQTESTMSLIIATSVVVDRDTDADGIADRLDIDSDNDGITDNIEAQTTQGYIAPSGQGAVMTDVDQDGLDDAYDANTASQSSMASAGLLPVDSDADATPDMRDTDSDGDGLLDIAERGDGQPTSLTDTTDSDGDGLLDIFEGSNTQDGFDVNDQNLTGSIFNLADTDADTAANGSDAQPRVHDLDYRDNQANPLIDLNSTATANDPDRNNAVSYLGNAPAIAIATASADVNDFGENDITQLVITLNGVADGSAEILNIAGVDFILDSDSTQTVLIGSDSFSVSYSVALGFIITSAGGGVMPQSSLDSLVRGMRYRNTLIGATDGVRSLSFVVTDASGAASNTAIASINVTASNTPPVGVDDNVTASEDTPLSGNVLSNDVDADGDTLSVVDFSVQGQTYNPGETVMLSGVGSITIGANGQFLFTPEPNYNGAVPTISYTLSDGNSSDTADLIIGSITAVNDAPQATDDIYTMVEDEVNLPLDLLANDSDIDGEQPSILSINGETLSGVAQSIILGNGTVNVAANGSLSFTPNADFTGLVTFDYVISDAAGLTSQATVTIEVTPLNDAPVVVDSTISMAEDGPALALDLLSNASDADADALMVISINGELLTGGLQSIALSNGTVNVAADGSLSFSPNPDFNGSVDFTYEVSDGQGATTSAMVTINVTPVVDIVADTVTTNEDTPINFNVLIGTNGASADRFEDANAQVTAITQPPVGEGTVSFTADGNILYSPPANFNGSTSFTYTVTSGGVTETTTVSVNVTAVNDAPQVTQPASYSATEDTSLPLSGIQLTDIDAGADDLTLSFNVPVASGTLVAVADSGVSVTGSGTNNLQLSGSLADINAYLASASAPSFEPTADFNGATALTLSVSDGNLQADSVSTIEVSAVTDIVADNVTTAEDTSITFNVLTGTNGASADNFENSLAEVVSITQPPIGEGRVTFSADGSLTFTPTSNFNGNTSFTYTVASAGVTETITVTVTVTPVADDVSVSGLGDGTASGTDGSVLESALANGTAPDGNGRALSGIFNIEPSGNLTQFRLGSAGPFSLAQLQASGTTPISIVGDYGTLQINGYDNATGAVSYTYVLETVANHSGGEVNESFTLGVTDIDGDTTADAGVLAIQIVDDVPIARADIDDAINQAGQPSSIASGNVLTGIGGNDPDSTDGVADPLGADGQSPSAGVSGVAAGTATPAIDALGTPLNGAYGSLTLNADGSYSYTPDFNNNDVAGLSSGEVLSDTFTYQIIDGDGSTASATLTINIYGTPTLVGTDGGSVRESDLANGTNPLDTGEVFNGSFIAASGTFPLASLTVDTVTFSLAELNGFSSAAPSAAIATAHGQLQISGYDQTTGEVTYRFTLNAAADHSGGLVFDSVELSITDSAGNSNASQPKLLNIEIIDDAPLVANDTATITEDAASDSVSGSVITDSDVYGADGPGAVSGVTAGGTAASGNIGISQTGSYGALTLAADGSYSYVLDNTNASVDGLQVGQTLTDLFSYQITDADGNISSAQLRITINGANDAPVASDDTYTMVEDGQALALNLFANDSDTDGDTLVAKSINGVLLSGGAQSISVPNGTVNVADDGRLSFSPNADFNGTVSFDYVASDGQGGEASATVTINVTAVDDIVADTLTTVEDTPISFNVLTGANGASADSFESTGAQVTAITQPPVGEGSVAFTANGDMTYTPPANFNGSTSFTYTVISGDVTETTTVTMTVTAVPDDIVVSGLNDGAAGTDGSVLESALSTGTEPSTAGKTLNGGFNLGPAANISNFSLGTSGSITVAQLQASGIAPISITGTNGTLVINGYDSVTGAVSYTYTLTSAADHSAGLINDSFILGFTDIDGDVTANAGTLALEIIDDTPVARTDVDDVLNIPSQPSSVADGNVLTGSGGVDPDSADGGADIIGADAVIAGTEITAVIAGMGVPSGANVGLEIAGTYGSLTLNADGSYSYTPAYDNAEVMALSGGQSLSDTFSYQITDSDGSSAVTTLTISIYGTPTLIGMDGGSVLESDLASGSTPTGGGEILDSSFFVANQPGFELASLTVGGITFSVTQLAGFSSATPSAAVTTTYGELVITGYDAATGEVGYRFTLTRAADHSVGAVFDSVTLSLTDSAGNDTSAYPKLLNIEIMDDTPLANDDVASITEDAAPNIINASVISNDQVGADMTTSAVTGVVAGSIATSGNLGNPLLGSYGSLTLNADGSYSYALDNANASVNGLQVGETLVDLFSYQITDADCNVSTAQLRITVNGADDAPLAVNDSYSTAEDTAVMLQPLLNDSDVDGDTLSIESINGISLTGNEQVINVTNGTVNIAADGSLNFTPALNYTGPVSFIYTVGDGNGGTATATINIDVTAVNDLPVAANDSYTTTEDTTLAITPLLNDTDVDGDALSLVSINGVALTGVAQSINVPSGEVNVAADGSLSFTPATDFNGTSSFAYVVEDSSGAAATASINITVTPVNDAPVAVDDSYSMMEDGPALALDLAVNDTDVDGDILSVKSINGVQLSGGVQSIAVSNGAVNIAADGSISFSPTADYNGPVSFTYVVQDPAGATATATVNISVTPVVDIAPDTLTTEEDSAISFNVLVGNDSFENSAAQVTAITQPPVGEGSVTFTADGNMTFTPATNFNGTTSFTYTVTSGGVTESTTVTINVTAVPDNIIVSGLGDGATPGTDGAVAESGLPFGTVPNATTATLIGSFNISPAANLASFSLGASGPINLAQLQASGSAPISIAGAFGTLIIDGYDTISGSVSYTYNLTTAADHSAGARNDNFIFSVTDIDGDTTNNAGILAVEVIDDTPTARADVDDVLNIDGQPSSVADGNVFSGIGGVDPDNTDGVADSIGADGAAVGPVTGVAHSGDVLSASNVGVAIVGDYGSLTLNADGSYSYVPNYADPAVSGLSAGQSLNDSFSYQITDADGDSVNTTLTLNILGIPTLIGTDGATVSEADLADGSNFLGTGEVYNGSFIAAITDNFPLASLTVDGTEFSAAELASFTSTSPSAVINTLHGELVLTGFDEASGTISYRFTLTSAADHSGGPVFDSLELSLTDTANNSTAAFPKLLNIEIVDDAPVALSDAASISEDAPNNTLSNSVIDNDHTGADATATPVTGVAAGGTAAAGNVASSVGGSYGQLTLNADGSYDYVLDNSNASVNALQVGESLVDIFTYQVTDNDGSTSSAQLRITINGSNDAPVAEPETYTTAEDTPVPINLLANDSDVDGDSLTIQSINGIVLVGGAQDILVPDGIVRLAADGSMSFIPDTDYNGPVSISYVVQDPDGLTANATATINVTPVNDPPVALDDNYSTNEDSPISLTPLLNDSDVDTGDSLSIVSINGVPLTGGTQSIVVSGGTVSVAMDGNLSFTPASNFNGVVSFAYVIQDPSGAMSSATISIDVLPVNDPPAAADDTYTTSEDTSVALDLLANDTDIDLDTLNIVSIEGVTLTGLAQVINVTNGTVNVAADGSMSFSPALNYTGSVSFDYEISDGNGGTDTATVTIMVTAVNDAPTAVDDSYTTAEDTTVALDLLLNDNDLDGDTVALQSINGVQLSGGAQTIAVANGEVVVDINGNLTFTPALNYFGPVSFAYVISDGDNATATALVNITVTQMNDFPVAVNDSYSMAEDDPALVLDLPINDTDVDGDALSVQSINGTLLLGGVQSISVTNGTVNIAADGTISFSPTADYNGPVNFDYVVEDSNGGTSTATVNIAVAAVADIVADSLTTDEDTPISFNVLTGSNGASTDSFENSGATVTAISQPPTGQGSVVFSANGDMTYTPPVNFNGTTSFTYIVTAAGTLETTTVTINVTSVQDDVVVTGLNDGTVVSTDGSVYESGLINGSQAGVGTVLNGSFNMGPGVNLDSFTLGSSGSISLAQLQASATAPISISGSYGTLIINGYDSLTGAVQYSYTLSTTADQSSGGVSDDFVLATIDIDGDFTSNAGTLAVEVLDDLPQAKADVDDAINFAGQPSSIASGNLFTGTDSGADPDQTDGVADIIGADGSALTGAVTGVSLGSATPDAANLGTPTQGLYGSLTLNSDGSYSYTPDYAAADVSALQPGESLSDEFSYRITDADGSTAVSTLTISIYGTPTLIGTAGGSVLESDLSTGSNADGTGEMLEGSFIASTTNSPLALLRVGTAEFTRAELLAFSPTDLSSVISTDHGELQISGYDQTTGEVFYQFTLTSAADHSQVEVEDWLVLSLVDENGNDTAQFPKLLTIEIVDDAPMAVDDGQTIVEGNQANSISSNLIDNDIIGADATTTPVSSVVAGASSTVNNAAVGILLSGSYGSLKLDADGSYVYTLNNANATVDGLQVGESLVDIFTYQITDADGDISTAQLRITINGTNDAPTVVNDSYTTIEDSSVALDPLLNDSDVEGDVLNLQSINGVTLTGGAQNIAVANGQVLVAADGSLSFVPAANFIGMVSFSYEAADSNGATASGVIDINVTPLNDVPVASDDNYITAEDTPLALNPLLNDTDVDGDTLSVQSINGITLTGGVQTITLGNSSISVAADGSLRFIPAANYNGSVSFAYSVSDGKGATASATIHIDVTPVNDAPQAGTVPPQSSRDADSVSLDLSQLFTDIDSPEGLQLSVNGLPPGLSFNPATGLISGILSSNASQDGTAGEYWVRVTATDSSGLSGESNFKWLVSNPSPIAANDAFSTPENIDFSANVLSNNGAGADLDPDGDNLQVIQVGGGAGQLGVPIEGSNGGRFIINTDGSFRFLQGSEFDYLPEGQTLTTQMSYTISDNQGGISTATITVTVIGVNDAPNAVADGPYITTPGSSTTGNVLINDTDIDGDNLSVTGVEVDTNGDGVTETISVTPGESTTIVLTAADGTLIGRLLMGSNGDFVFTPSPDYSGPVPEMTVSITDGFSTSKNSLSFTVLPNSDVVNVPPQLQGSTFQPLTAQASASTLDISGAVLDATNSVSNLRGTTALDADWVVLQAVNSLDPLLGIDQRAASGDFNGRSSAGMLSDSALNQQTGGSTQTASVASTNSVDRQTGVQLNLTGNQAWLDVVNLRSESEQRIVRIQVTQANGNNLPGWVKTNNNGHVSMVRPANVDTLRLRVTVERANGRSDTYTVDVDFNAVEVRISQSGVGAQGEPLGTKALPFAEQLASASVGEHGLDSALMRALSTTTVNIDFTQR